VDNMTPNQMLNSKLTKTLDTKDINDGINTLYFDVYKDRSYIISCDEKILLCTEDRERAFSKFYN